MLSSRWAELGTGCLLAAPCVVKEFDMHVCTVDDARGVGLAEVVEGTTGENEMNEAEAGGDGVPFDFDIVGRKTDGGAMSRATGPMSGFAGWFTVDFKSRTDEVGRDAAPQVPNPAYLSTGPEMGCECYIFATSNVGRMPPSLFLLSVT